jgi:ABC-type multidrug transport system ATPase subunit
VSAEQVATANAGTASAEPLVLLEVEAVGVRLSGQKILDGVSFAISEGERVGLIGPNGAGKTSLLEAVAGFAPLDAGQLRWRGAPLGAHDRKESLFYLPDGIRPCPDHRAGELVELFRVAYGQPRSRAEELVEVLQLGRALDKRVGHLSKGFTKRMLLALGMLTRAPLLLLDEPLDGLDLHQVAAVGSLFDRLRGEGRTLLLSIHELSLAERLCESFLLLAEGRLLAKGRLADLRRQAGIEAGGLDRVFFVLT